MVDFHTHILPGIDDGAEDIETSLALLKRECEQGIDTVYLTPHFYPTDMSLNEFLQNRDEAFEKLKTAIDQTGDEELSSIDLRLGAEIYYFPGIADATQLTDASMEKLPCILIEPPMEHFRESMLRDIEKINSTMGLVPIIAHVDRYCRVVGDYSFFDAIKGRKILVQCNGTFFINVNTEAEALEYLKSGAIHILGSDCHNLTNRVPNIGYAKAAIEEKGYGEYYTSLEAKSERLVAAGRRE